MNGFNAGRGFGGPRDLSGIESVDVLKGPRAALFGRGEPGGTVNLVTKRPTFKKAGEFRVSAGSFETYRADADWTTPLSDAVAVRLLEGIAGGLRLRDIDVRHGDKPDIRIDAERVVCSARSTPAAADETDLDARAVAGGVGVAGGQGGAGQGGVADEVTTWGFHGG